MALFIAIAPLAAQADIASFQGIEAGENLDMLQKRLPNARFLLLPVAWVLPGDAFYEIGGDGLVGIVRVKFSDSAPLCRRAMENPKNTPELQESLQRCVTRPHEQTLFVDWVRWIPPSPIPLPRLEARYGKAVCKDDANFQMACAWVKAGLTADMTSDGKAALQINRFFSDEETAAGIEERGKIN